MSLFKRPLAAIGFSGFAALVAAALCPFWVGVALALLCLVLGIAGALRRPTRRAAVCLLTAAVALSSFLLYEGCVCAPLREADGKTLFVCGTVVKTQGVSHGVLTATVRVTDGDLPQGTRVTLRAPFSDLPPEYGDRIEAVSALEYDEAEGLFDTERANRILLSGWTEEETDFTLVRSGEASLRKSLEAARSSVANALLNGMTQDVRPLLSAMCLGDKSDLSDETTDAFRSAGVSHLLVVSGLHMSIVAMGAYGLLRAWKAGRKTASAAALLALWAFALLIGFHPSVVRACVLNTLVLSGNLFRRRADGLNSLGGGLLFLWLVSPFCVYDVGLWLSFGATLGLLCLLPRMTAACDEFFKTHSFGVLAKPLRYAAESLCVTLAATVPILPICALVFGEISLVAPLSNLLCVFAATLLLWCAAGALLLQLLPFGFFAGGLRLGATLLARYLLWATDCCGGLPHAVLTTEQGYRKVWVLVTPAVVMLLWRLRGGKRAAVGFAACCAVLVVLCVGETALTKGQTEVTLKRAYGDNALLLTQDGTSCLLVDGGNGWTAAETMVESAHMDEVDTVVIFSPDRRLTRKWKKFNESITVGRYVLAAYNENTVAALKAEKQDVTVSVTTALFENGRVTMGTDTVSVSIGGESFVLTDASAAACAETTKIYDLKGTEDVSFTIR